MFIGDDLYCDYCKGSIPLHWQRRVLADGRVMCQECMGIEDPDRPHDHGERCAGCGYNLTGVKPLQAGGCRRCPECGREVRPQIAQTAQIQNVTPVVARPAEAALAGGVARCRWFWRCAVCQQLVNVRKVAPGSFLGECGVWLICGVITLLSACAFWPVMIAALAFSLYRMMTRNRVCGQCGSPAVGRVRLAIAPRRAGAWPWLRDMVGLE
jgi:hypothetical protein